jgi:hypothetical protein
MIELETLLHFLRERCFAEAAYFAALRASESGVADDFVLAGLACCGCVGPSAIAQRLLEGAEVAEESLGGGGLRVSPATPLVHAGFAHLINALRRDPAARVPTELIPTAEAIADDLAFASRRELHSAVVRNQRGDYAEICRANAVLLRRLCLSTRELPAIRSYERANELIAAELAR